MKQWLADIVTLDKVLAVVLSANTLIIGYLHGTFPAYVDIVSGVLAGVAIFVSVDLAIVRVLADAKVEEAAIKARLPYDG
jgi:phage shock protein PspC (stress-responsive transcriptional regulator)